MGTSMVRSGSRPGSARLALALAIAGALALVAIPLTSPAASAAPTSCQDRWINPQGGPWSTAANWSSGVPTGSETACVEIPLSAPVTAPDVSVSSLVIGQPAGATGSATVAFRGTTSVSGTISVLATGTVTAANTLELAGGSFVDDGTFATSANLSLKGDGAFTVGSSGLFQASTSDQVLLEGPGSFTNEGAVVVEANGSLYMDPSPESMTFDNVAGVFADEGGDVQVQSDATFVEGSGSVVGAAGTNAATPAIRVLGGTLDLTGSGRSSFEVANGTLEGTIGAQQAVEVLGTVTTTGAVMNDGTVLAPAGGTLNIAPASSLTNDGLIAVRSAQFNLDGTLINGTAATLALASQLVLNGPYDLTNDGTISIAPSGDVLATFTSGIAAAIDNASGTIADGVQGNGGFVVDQGVTFTEGSGTTSGGDVEVEGALDLDGTGTANFVVSDGSIDGDVAAGQSVTFQGTDSAASSFQNDGQVDLRGATLNLPAGGTLTNDAELGLTGGQSTLNGNVTNSLLGTMTISDGTELVDSSAGSIVDNAGQLYLLNQDSIYDAAGVAFVNTGDLRFGVIGGSWGGSGLHADIEAAGSAPQSVELGGSLEPVFPEGEPPNDVTLPSQWVSGDGATIAYTVAQVPSTTSAPFNTITCGASTQPSFGLSCTDEGGLDAIQLTDLAPGLVPTNVSLQSSAPSISGPCGAPACPDSSYGQSVTLTATVAAEYGSAPPTGTVTFFDGPYPIGSSSVVTSGGATTATLTTATLAVGTHEFAAVYSGSSSDVAGNSSQLEEAVATQTPTVALTAPSSTFVGAPTELVATVSPAAPAPSTPTGIVAFFEGSDLLGFAPVATGDGGATATLSTTSLGVGASDSITALYEGDPSFAAATSSSSTVSVGVSGFLRVLPTGPGSGSVHGGGIVCPSTCTALDAQGASAVLTATPASGSSFAGWSGAGCAGRGACHPALGGVATVTAAFVPSATHLKAALAAQIAPKGAAARLRAIVKADGYAYRGFRLLEPGTATVTWTRVHDHSTTTIASGRLALAGAGTGVLTVDLSPAGKELLSDVTSVGLKVTGTFKPTASAAVGLSLSVTLHR